MRDADVAAVLACAASAGFELRRFKLSNTRNSAVEIRNSEFKRVGAGGCNRFQILDFTVQNQISDFTSMSPVRPHTDNFDPYGECEYSELN